MEPSVPPQLPADVLERIFSIGQPRSQSKDPVLSDRERIRCQLVSKAWQHALNPARWPLWHLELLAEHREAVPAVALWLHRVQPGVQRLTVNLSPDLAEVWEGPAWDFSLWDNSPAAEAVHAALLSLQPLSRGQLLRLRATFAVLERFCPILSRFPGLEQLELEVPLLLYSPSVLDKPLLQHLPPQLASLAVTHIDRVHLSPTAAAAGAAAEPSSSAAPALLPALKQLRIGYALSVELDMPLPSLATLTIEGRAGGLVCLAGAGLSLPQLTSLLLLQITYMEERLVVHLHCSAMPALEHLENGGSLLVARDGFEALQQLTRLQMTCNWGAPEHEIDADLLGSVAGSLRSLSLDTVGGIELERQALRMAAAAELERLTQLECNSTACLEHLPTAWPSLQVLQLRGGVLPTAITPEQLALLAVAPHLQRLELFVDASNRMLWQFDRQFRQANNNRVEGLRRALPGRTVEWHCQ